MLKSADLDRVNKTAKSSAKRAAVNDTKNYGFRKHDHRTISNPERSDVLQARVQAGIMREGKCPRCTRKTWHERVETNWFTRDVFRCTDCQLRTLPCTRGPTECPNMAAGLSGWDEDYCAPCGGWKRGDPTEVSLIEKIFQSSRPPKNRDLMLEKRFFCSFCLESSWFMVEKERTSMFDEDVYRCESCTELATQCRSCDAALARCYSSEPLEYEFICVKCDGLVKDWDRPSLLDRLWRECWCTECHWIRPHQMWKKGGLLSATIFRCMYCGEKSIDCDKCITRGRKLGSRRLNHDESIDDLCLCCQNPPQPLLRKAQGSRSNSKIFDESRDSKITQDTTRPEMLEEPGSSQNKEIIKVVAHTDTHDVEKKLLIDVNMSIADLLPHAAAKLRINITKAHHMYSACHTDGKIVRQRLSDNDTPAQLLKLSKFDWLVIADAKTLQKLEQQHPKNQKQAAEEPASPVKLIGSKPR